jgi:acetyltransferase-like isoleucine patch superfamily enzyme
MADICQNVLIGDDCLIWRNVVVYSASYCAELRRKQYEFSKLIIIESGIWIGGGQFVFLVITNAANSVIEQKVL